MICLDGAKMRKDKVKLIENYQKKSSPLWCYSPLKTRGRVKGQI